MLIGYSIAKIRGIFKYPRKNQPHPIYEKSKQRLMQK